MANLTQKQYIQKFYPEVVRATKGTGIFPEVAIVQSALESGNGNSTLAKDYNNHFGIKADKTWKGKSVNLDTREVYSGESVYEKANFRVYDSYEDSARDYVKFLKTFKRYHDAGVFKAKTPQQQIDAIKRAGYATDPYYDSKLKTIIKSNLSLIQSFKLEDSNAPFIALLVIGASFMAYRLYKEIK
jgi:flagellum-specific peptidoglycan hydrolase FlgJ